MVRARFVFLGAAIVLAAAPVAGGGEERTHPVVRVVDHAPLTVRGERFAPGERVRVTVVVRGDQSVRTAKAAARGTFTVRFPRLMLSECAAYVVRASGNAGSKAGTRMIPPPCGVEPGPRP